MGEVYAVRLLDATEGHGPHVRSPECKPGAGIRHLPGHWADEHANPARDRIGVNSDQEVFLPGPAVLFRSQTGLAGTAHTAPRLRVTPTLLLSRPSTRYMSPCRT
jgi:hypothetical protein